MNKKELIIHSNTSAHLFKNNQIIDFKTILPRENYIQSYSSICIKNVLCKITRDNVLKQSSPVLLKTGYSNVSDFFENESITSSSKKNVFNSLLGSFHVRHDSIRKVKSTYLQLKKSLIRKTQFYSLINRTFVFMSIPFKINISKISRVQFIPKGQSSENIFVSRYFLVLCGFAQHQLDTIEGCSIEHKEKYFNLKHVVGFIADNPYCPNLNPPANFGVESTSLGGALHNFTGDTSRLLCSVQNNDNKYSITKHFKKPIWFDISKILGGVLHIRICSNDHTQKELQTKINKLVLHIVLQNTTMKEKRELIFVKLSANDTRPSQNQSFLGKLSHPVKLTTNNTISLKSVKTGGFRNILPEDQVIELVKFLEGVEERISVKITQSTFKSCMEFVRCLNISFDGHKIIFTQRKNHLTIINEDTQNIVLNPSPNVNKIFGHDGVSIKLIPNRTHTFSRMIDLCACTPKILSIRTSLGSNNGFVELLDIHQNIVFLSDNENPPYIDLKDKYYHTPGLFSYIRLTFSDLLENDFKINNKHIYISFVIENPE